MAPRVWLLTILPVLPEIVNAAYAGCDNAGRRGIELLLFLGHSTLGLELLIVTEDQQRFQQDFGSAVLEQRLPCRAAQCDGIEEAGGPIGDDGIAVGPCQ